MRIRSALPSPFAAASFSGAVRSVASVRIEDEDGTVFAADLARKLGSRKLKTGFRRGKRTLDGNDVVTDENASTFASLVANCLSGQSSEAVAIKNVSAAKTALRILERKVDRDNKRWYGAWTKAFLQGTAEGDAARSQIPTEQGTLPAQALQILSATSQPDHMAQLTFDPDGGLHATTLELQWRLPGDVDFGHTTAVVRAGQTVGPFPPNTLVTFRTRGSNSTPGVALSATVSLLVN